eukprot:3933260-Pyramimonas_sp.AAC.1
MEQQARDYLAKEVEPLLRVILKRLVSVRFCCATLEVGVVFGLTGSAAPLYSPFIHVGGLPKMSSTSLTLVGWLQAIDRPTNARKYIAEQLQRQAALEARAKDEKKTKTNQDGGQTDEDPMEEKDTLQDEEEFDLNTLLFPD